MIIGCVDLCRDPEGRVHMQHYRQLDPGRPRLVFDPYEWGAILYDVNAYRWEYRKIPLAMSPISLADALSDRLM